ncbi:MULTISPECIES: iron-sulfur cluster repair di-iron protein [Paenibacillus]|jgi:regulator of cell morphogenesis and NO signaling|uniref:iron-sulfur cluster repair di-iron protein n=1 Tax=Paenibacillus TaxID=44249 RepID=UPI000A606D04|nr:MULTISPECIES: iron-sulfur cluster repair di-iron protein [Paenibacillus]MDU4698481.1 iron-sulfur cluster repair di-iron protein [Paenibacillus sp.]
METNSMHFQLTDKVRDIVLRFPKAADYFRQQKIDFCCGGNRPLDEAAAERGISADPLLEDLNRMLAEHPHTSEGENWLNASSADLVGHIVGKHHRYLREELPEIQKYVTKVARVHGESDTHLLEVARLFGDLRRELLEHTDKEEAEVFPKMLNWEVGQEPEVLEKLQAAITELEAEHDGAGDILKQLRELTEDFQPPMHACTTYRLTYARLEELEGMTFTHVHLENNVLFPRYTE